MAVPPSAIISGFVKAEIVDVPLPEDEKPPLAASTDDLPLSLAALFQSDSESSDFEGFDSDADERCAWTLNTDVTVLKLWIHMCTQRTRLC